MPGREPRGAVDPEPTNDSAAAKRFGPPKGWPARPKIKSMRRSRGGWPWRVGTVLGQLPGAGSPVRVAVGGDGRWLSAPLVAAVSLGCQRAGCRVIEMGNATAGSLAMVIRQTGLDGGILIGNALAAPQTVSLKCWGPEGRPWSAGGGLEPVRRRWPTRRFAPAGDSADWNGSI